MTSVNKEQALCDTLASLESVIVAYSGGVDSSYLAYIASRTLGDRAVAVTADSPSYPERHRNLAIQIARDFGLRHEIIHTGELENPEYRANPANRCYYCKHELYTHLSRLATTRHAVVVDGNNADDRGDYRPGRQAAREFGVRSRSTRSISGRTKSASCRAAGLPTWDEPASACLSSRIHAHEVTDAKLHLDAPRRCAHSASACSASAITTMAAHRGARSEMPRAPAGDCAAIVPAEGSATATSASTCRATARAAGRRAIMRPA
jgi:uncharacterized protein